MSDASHAPGSLTPPAPLPPPSSPPPPPPGYAAPQVIVQQPRQRGWLNKLLSGLLIASLLLNLYLGFIVASLFSGTDEKVLEVGTSGTQRVVVLPIRGAIDDDMSRFVDRNMRRLILEAPGALVLRVESGGGGVTASDQIWKMVDRFKAEHPDVPVVASFGGVAASGGYYVAAGADRIYCEPTGMTGSIGVIAQIPTLETAMDKLGVDWVTVVADGSPDKDVANNLFRTWQAADVEKLKDLTGHAYDRFTEVVAAGRGERIPTGTLPEVADGDVYDARAALSNGLVDEIGYLADAVAFAAAEAGLGENPRVTEVTPRVPGLLGLLQGTSRVAGLVDADTPLPGSPEHLRKALDELRGVRLEYRAVVQ